MDAQKAYFEINRMARLLKVSRSGYYRWAKARNSPPGPRKTRRKEIDARVRKSFFDSDEVYGAPRVQADLAKNDFKVNVKTVAASMRRQGLEGISPRMFTPTTTIPGVAKHRVRDLTGRHWDTGELNRVWISDITYLRTGEGWLYLCVVRDACSRRVIGWAMDTTLETGLVERALRMAHTLRGSFDGRVVFHSDRGCQYTSEQLWNVCKQLEIDQSMGRTGVCWDNAMAESFFASLKTEFYHRHSWPTRANAKTEVARWIEVVYNRRRLHSQIDYTTPVEYEHYLNTTNQEQQAA